MTSEQLGRAAAAVSSLPRLGAGESLPAAAQRSLETMLGRPVGDVRIHVSSVAETLGAEAFTTGRRIVFAPGRLDLGSDRGLALVGHELAHVGQALAFKQSADGDTPTDDDERTARQQEATIQRIVEQGCPEGPRMELRRGAPPPPVRHERSGAPSAVAATAVWTGGGPGQVVQLAPLLEAAGGEVGPGQPAPMAGLVAAAPPPDQTVAGPASPDIALLARQVYAVLRAQLRAERDRHGVYGR